MVGDCMVNDDRTNVNGTHLQGYVDISYGQLVEILGPPIRSHGGKVQAEWTLDRGGVVATIYDWKQYSTPPESVRDWHIGGHDPDAVWLVEEVLGIQASRRGW